jgi:archaellum component FlaC
MSDNIADLNDLEELEIIKTIAELDVEPSAADLYIERTNIQLWDGNDDDLVIDSEKYKKYNNLEGIGKKLQLGNNSYQPNTSSYKPLEQKKYTYGHQSAKLDEDEDDNTNIESALDSMDTKLDTIYSVVECTDKISEDIQETLESVSGTVEESKRDIISLHNKLSAHMQAYAKNKLELETELIALRQKTDLNEAYLITIIQEQQKQYNLLAKFTGCN